MSFITPPITNAVALTNSDPNTGTLLNANFDPIKNFTAAIDGLTRVTTSSPTYNIAANTEVVIYVDASGGNRIVNLPTSVGQLHSITVKKIDAAQTAGGAYNTVTVTRTASNTVESRNLYAISPATFTYVLSTPDQSVTLSPNGTQYRVESEYINPRIMASASMTSNQAFPASTVAKLGMTTETFDYSNNYNAVLSRFIAPADGLYEFNGHLLLTGLSGSPFDCFFEYYKNGASYQTALRITTAFAGVPGRALSTCQIPLLAGEFVELFGICASGSSFTVFAGVRFSYWNSRLVYLGL